MRAKTKEELEEMMQKEQRNGWVKKNDVCEERFGFFCYTVIKCGEYTHD